MDRLFLQGYAGKSNVCVCLCVLKRTSYQRTANLKRLSFGKNERWTIAGIGKDVDNGNPRVLSVGVWTI